MPETLDPYWFPCDGPLFGIPHFWNVFTNVPFLFLGLIGLRALHALRATTQPRVRPWAGLWVATALLCVGSGLYHFFLTPLTLALDRVCIAAISAALCWHALIVAGQVRDRWMTGLALLLAFEVPVAAWYWFDVTSLVYGLTQAFVAVFVLVVHVRRARRTPERAPRSWPLIALVVSYAAAKLLEVADHGICDATGCIGGHPIKHLLSGLGLAFLVLYMRDDLRDQPD